MQTEEDRRIQNKLENAGKGLPKIDAIFSKHVGFPILKTLMSWNIAMRFFESEGKKILIAVKEKGNDDLFKKILISKTFGIEDNSRYYSPAMVLWHLIFVGQTIQEGIINLSKGGKIDFVVKIENFKPFVVIDNNIVEQYEDFLNNYRNIIEENVEEKFLDNCHTHPWFGCLNPYEWLVMSAIHQMVHRRQIERILK